MVRRRKRIERTVQFWRLVDGRDGSTVQHVDWYAHWLPATGATRHAIDGVDLTGSVHVPGVKERVIGLVVASQKDYVPRQQDGSGAQAPMRLDGVDWDPVDNTFILFLPFGNMFAVLAESVSSTRASMFVRWLNLATGRTTRNGAFFWAAEPVIDRDRAEKLERATGLRKLKATGRIGTHVETSQGVWRALGGSPPEQIGAWNVKIEISRVRGVSTPGDEEELRRYFDQTFGHAGLGAESRLQVETSPSGTQPALEIDLIRHRLTRKAKVVMSNLPGRSFDTEPAIDALVDAYRHDTDVLSDLAHRLERANPLT